MSGPIDSPLAITAIGSISPTGLNAPQTAASIRAGLVGASEHAYYNSIGKDPDWDEEEPLVAASVSSIDPELDGAERLRELAIPTLLEVAGNGRLNRRDLNESCLLVAMPVLDEDVMKWMLPERFVAAVCRDTGLEEFASVRENHSGHTGAFELIVEAVRILTSRECRYCWLLGVDTHLSEGRMELWDSAWRLRSPRNADGFIPGEAGAALILETLESARARSAQILATIEAVAITSEPQPRSSQRASTGSGLCSALELVSPTDGMPQWICNDLNGESYRAHEWGLATVRLHETLSSVREIHCPAESTGDIGAATGTVLLNYAAFAMTRSHPPGREALLWTASDESTRASARIRTHDAD